MDSPSGLNPDDVKWVLQQTLGELERVKRQIARPNATRELLQASLSNLEHGIRRQAQQIFEQAAATEQMSASQPMQTAQAVTYKPKPVRLSPSPLQLEKTSTTKANLVNNPQSEQARKYLEERFGIPSPTRTGTGGTPDKQSAVTKLPPAASIVRGKSAAVGPGVILPRHLREDVHAVPPPEVTDLELEKGLLHMVNRGLLPPKVDLTPALCGDTGPYRAGGAPLYPYQAQFYRPPPTSALEDALRMRADFKMDLITPVVKPSPSMKLPALSMQNMRLTDPSAPDTQPDASGQDQNAATSGRGSPDQDEDRRRSGTTASARGFETLMDNYSLHEFMIRKGAAITNTPEFESYARTFDALWPIITGLIRHLEALCVQYALPLAVVNGKNLAELADAVMSEGYTPSMEDLLVCLSNVQEVAGLLREPGRRFMGPSGQDSAAALIQSHYKGYLARRKYSKKAIASTTIQSAWRNNRLRTKLRDKLQQARQERDLRFAELQGQLSVQWPLMRRNAHVVIHVPSLSVARPPSSMLGTGTGTGTGTSSIMNEPSPAVRQALLLREAAQLARLCDLAEPLLDLIIVLPSPPDADVINYWNKILEVGGVGDPGSRYRIVVPENHARLPAHMSVTAKLLASPRALKRIQAAVHGRLAYIVPGTINDEEVDLAVQLGVPLLGPTPSVGRALSRKSAARALFKSIAANVAPGLEIRPARAPPPSPGTAGSSLLSTPPTAQAEASASRGSPSRGRTANTVDPLKSPLRPGTDFALGPNGEVIVREGQRPESPMGLNTPVLPNSNLHHKQQLQQQQLAALRALQQRQDNEAAVLMAVSQAMVRHPHVSKWLLKIDDEIMGQGHAYFDTASLKGAPEVMAHAAAATAAALRNSAMTGLGGGDTGPLSEEQQVAVFRLYEVLARQLPWRLNLACKDVYPDYGLFIEALAEHGGVVEACPETAVGSPTVNLFIDPSGAITVLSTHEKIFCSPYRAVGTTFPQSSVPHRALYDAAVAVGTAAYNSGVVGHAVVDFVTLSEIDGTLRLWAVDFRPGIAQSLLSFQLFDFLTAGEFNAMAGTYYVQSESLDYEPSSTAGSDDEDDAAGPSGRRRSSSHQGGPTSTVESQRHYFSIEQLTHPAIKCTPCSKFFFASWQSGFHFDVDNRQGVIFNLSDRYLTSGAMGITCVSLTPSAMYSQMSKVLAFVNQLPVDSTLRAAWQLTNDMAYFQDCQALVKYMAEQSISQEQQLQRKSGGLLS